ncbi:MAG: hypothetical protein ACMXYG_03300 [Candidatus Woesearchaeota archaeon]
MTQWKMEYRAFMDDDPTLVRQVLDHNATHDGLTKRVQDVTDTYIVGESDVTIRTRDGSLKAKGPVKSVDDTVYELQDNRPWFPLTRETVNDTLGIPTRKKGIFSKKESDPKSFATWDALIAYAKERGLTTATVQKSSAKYEGAKLEVEVTKVTIDGAEGYTIAVMANDTAAIHDAMDRYCLKGHGTRMSYAGAIREAKR